MKKRPLTLFEVVISLTLTAFVLAALLMAAHRLFTSTSMVEKSKRSALARAHTYERLLKLFDHIPKNGAETKDLLQSEGGMALEVALSNLIDKKSAFCQEGRARLELVGKDLLLTQWGNGDVLREEVLLRKVHALHFEFFDAQAEPAALIQKWTKRKGELPAYLLMHIQEEGAEEKETVDFAFFFPSQDNVIIYPTKAVPCTSYPL